MAGAGVCSRDGFGRLDALAAARVATALSLMEHRKPTNAKGVGQGVFEYPLDHRPVRRVYFGRDSEVQIVFLGGGMKVRQQRDIDTAGNR